MPLSNGFFFSLLALSEQSESSKQCPTLQPYVKFAANVGAQLCESNSCLKRLVMLAFRGAFDSTDHEHCKRSTLVATEESPSTFPSHLRIDVKECRRTEEE